MEALRTEVVTIVINQSINQSIRWLKWRTLEQERHGEECRTCRAATTRRTRVNALHARAHLVVLQVLLIGVVELLSAGRVVDGFVQGISEVHHVRV